MKRFSIFLVLLLFFIGIFFLFPQPAAAIGETAIVQINGLAQPPGFSPALLTIHMYDTVIFINRTNAPYAVTADDGSFSSPAIPAGQQWRVTFSSTGGHSYHTTEAPQRMIGEIVVVANTVSLLPTPVPQVEATVVAMIKAGKHPPDTIVLPVITSPAKHNALVPAVNTLLTPLNIELAGGVLLAIVLIFLGIILYRRHAKHARDEEEMDMLLEEIIPSPVEQKVQVVEKEPVVKKRRLLPAGFSWKRSRTDENDDIEDDEEKG